MNREYCLKMFDTICGNCAGVDIMTLTDDDIREQAEIWGDCTQDEINAAIEGLHIYQEDSLSPIE